MLVELQRVIVGFHRPAQLIEGCDVKFALGLGLLKAVFRLIYSPQFAPLMAKSYDAPVGIYSERHFPCLSPA